MTQNIEQTLLSLCERSEQLMAVFDGGDRLRWANAAFRRVFELRPDEHPLWEELMRRSWQNRRGARSRAGRRHDPGKALHVPPPHYPPV